MSARLTLLGSPTIALGGTPLALPFERRSQLLVYLAFHPRGAGRDELLEHFWLPSSSIKFGFGIDRVVFDFDFVINNHKGQHPQSIRIVEHKIICLFEK